jgi:hypothetical protein
MYSTLQILQEIDWYELRVAYYHSSANVVIAVVEGGDVDGDEVADE